MADHNSGDADSRRSLLGSLRAMLGMSKDQSLRSQLEDAIDEHEEDASPSPAGDLSPIERQMMRNLLHFSEHDADDVAIPRREIVAVPTSLTWDEMIAAFAQHGHSRMPVYAESLDEVKGMIHIKDVFPYLASAKAPPKDWTTLMRQPLFVPQSRNAIDVLADMRASRTHLAVVFNEYSGTEGIVTIEDLVEEIVGDIEDEHDDAPTDLLVALEGGMWEADAGAELEDVGERIDPRLGEVEEDVDTLGGLAFLLAEQVPPVGAMLDHSSGWRLEVIAGNERHVTRLRLHPPVSAVVSSEED
ncbi:MAG: hemolysin family protein [Novosphingobium sp.]